MKKPSGHSRNFMYSMLRKFNSFKRSGKISLDGSIFYDDERWAGELDCSNRTIQRARQYWDDCGVIRYKKGRGRSKRTRYWLIGDPKPILNRGIKKDDKLSTFNCEKQDNLLPKVDKKVSKSGQNVPPYIDNKDINKSINKQTNQFCMNKGNTEFQATQHPQVDKEPNIVDTQDSLNRLINLGCLGGLDGVARMVEKGEIKLADGVTLP